MAQSYITKLELCFNDRTRVNEKQGISEVFVVP